MSVYFLRVGSYVKIGYSADPEKRMAKIWRSTTRYSRPWDLSVKAELEPLAVIDGEKSTEREIHEALAHFRSNAEWFIDEPPLRDFIERAGRGDLSPVERDGGRFEQVSYEHMLPERRDEIKRMLLLEFKKRETEVSS